MKTATESLIGLLDDEDFRDNVKGKKLVSFINTRFKIERIIPKCDSKWGDKRCENDAKWTESDGRGGLVRVCTPCRRQLTRQKRLNNNY